MIGVRCTVVVVSVLLVLTTTVEAQEPPPPGGPGGERPRGGFGGSMTQTAPEGSGPPSPDPRNITGVWTIVRADEYEPFTVKPEFAGVSQQPGPVGFAVPSIDSRKCKPNSKFEGISYPMQILQTPGRVTLIQEEHRRIRRIYLDREVPVDPEPAYYGHSVGHWEGDTLVVETSGLMGELPFSLTGAPDIHVTEHVRKTDEGRILEFKVTLDSEMWQTPASFRVRYNWRPDAHLLEYACEEYSDPFGVGYDSLR
jgi:hypothetical protein